MSKKYLINETTLTDIASAIRTKTNSTEDIPVTNFANEILNIQGGEDLSVEIATQEEKIAEQDTIIANLMTALEGKAAGSSAKTTKTIYLDWSGDETEAHNCTAIYMSNHQFVLSSGIDDKIKEIEAEGGIVIVYTSNAENASYASSDFISYRIDTGKTMIFYTQQDGGTIYIALDSGLDI